MIIKFLIEKSKLTKLFRSHGYTVSEGRYVYADKYPYFDLTDFIKSKAIKITGKEQQRKKIRGQKKMETLTPGFLLKQYLKGKRYDFALQIAKSVHEIHPLYTSSRGDIETESRGGDEQKDWGAYAKTYGHPAVWKNAGVMIENGQINVYTSRRKLAFTMKCPLVRDMKKYEIGGFGVEAVYGMRSVRGMYKLYDINKKFFTLAKQMPNPACVGKFYWEHGYSIEKIQEEYERKRVLYFKEEHEKMLYEKKKRAFSLAKRLVNNVLVNYDDARAVGYCEAGINNFISTHLDGKREVKISILKRFDQTERLVDSVIQKVVNNRFQEA